MDEYLKRVNQTFQEWEEIIESFNPEKETWITQTEYYINKKTWNGSRANLLKEREQLRRMREQKRQDAVTILQGLISCIEKTDEGFVETEKKFDDLLKRLDEKFNKLQLQHDNYLDKVQSNNKGHGQGVKTFNLSVRADEFNRQKVREAGCPNKVPLPVSDENLLQAEKRFHIDFKQLDDKFNKWKLENTSNSDKVSLPVSDENLQAEKTFYVDFKQLDDKFNKWKLEYTSDFNKHLEPMKQPYCAAEQVPLLPQTTQPPPSVSKEEQPSSPPSGSMNIASPNVLTPPTTGYPALSADYVAAMKAYMQYYNQPAPSGYTAEQWLAVQQQSWAQWQQWQQQYQQWQAQYGEKYQESMKQYSAAGQAPPFPVTLQPPPPPPKEEKPPLPPSGSVSSYGYNTASPVSLSPSDENLSQEEKRFDELFIGWDNKFSEWKLLNANHPNKETYEIYEAKWTYWREKLIEKREEIRRRHELLRLWNKSRKGYPS